jgi:hypothetical protein
MNATVWSDGRCSQCNIQNVMGMCLPLDPAWLDSLVAWVLLWGVHS